MGVIPLFISALGQPDHELQHLASVAICNMCANNARHKAEARDFGAVEIFCHLIRDNEVSLLSKPMRKFENLVHFFFLLVSLASH